MFLPHQQRVIEELYELVEKRAKLQAFFDTVTFSELDLMEKVRLKKQVRIMGDYVDILEERILYFSLKQPRYEDENGKLWDYNTESGKWDIPIKVEGQSKL